MPDSAVVSPGHGQGTPRLAARAAWIGSALEYYDFFIYGTAAALVFGKVFFSSRDPAAGTLASLATFGVGYAARPIGAIVLGHLGDRHGRRKVLLTTVIAMGTATFLVGCLPSYQAIGLAAPVLLVCLRLLQGFFAGGEQAGANSLTLEHAPERRRAFFTSFTLGGTQAGQAIATAIFIPIATRFVEVVERLRQRHVVDPGERGPFAPLFGGGLEIAGPSGVARGIGPAEEQRGAVRPGYRGQVGFTRAGAARNGRGEQRPGPLGRTDRVLAFHGDGGHRGEAMRPASVISPRAVHQEADVTLLPQLHRLAEMSSGAGETQAAQQLFGGRLHQPVHAQLDKGVTGQLDGGGKTSERDRPRIGGPRAGACPGGQRIFENEQRPHAVHGGALRVSLTEDVVEDLQ